ncbi:hypothetical protein [Burkholderia ambifaria]|uniref:hypothetical protein n=1 Tax=Burkholderia ambifaria TaxID=152480 RepID=UPI0015888472|nr:hypothetical protein [Burkholderia ambifaria]
MLIFGAFLVFAATYASIRAGSIRDYYSDARRVENERQTEIAKTQAADANKGAERAKADAAKANESAEATRQENLKLQIALEKERADRLQLEDKVAPRTLSDAERSSMAAKAQAVCSSVRRVVVTAANSNNEAQRYGHEFIEILRHAGCEADLALPIPGLEPSVLGIHIVVKDTHNIPPSAAWFSKILDAGQIAYTVNPSKPDFFPNEPWVLAIGGKPLPGMK